jgi:hypothetical protein
MKRKGWHRKKRRLRHDYRAQFRNTLFGHYRRKWARIFSAGDEGENSLLLACGVSIEDAENL